LLSDSQQRQIVAQAKQALGLCAIRDDPLALYQGAPPPRTPLVAFLDDDFKPIASYPPYVVEIRR
jgi:DNA-binding transcriptional MocR family regulator